MERRESDWENETGYEKVRGKEVKLETCSGEDWEIQWAHGRGKRKETGKVRCWEVEMD